MKLSMKLQDLHSQNNNTKKDPNLNLMIIMVNPFMNGIKSKNEILNTLQEIGMTNMAFRCALNNPDYRVALIVSGFTRQLKSWWDNALTFQQKKDIVTPRIL